ncbi:major facilitator superfamily transporter [Dothidotthia symphoricarpi CBS 119687]|uniref:Major facilitator superfamily transporter n=1 Tax=Dothidotthia symphoricarpi CBS 119687 TaxID=1392245 RepID=A0A6A6AS03_9PLEO|nr:major facilitator superfamily transporter [Dothidotthia symphoricarpi CBS 119687]KAF2133775.1 major facilitator superfamily transporter [Dothidotthia symphoricarpi CBS 119687]
MTINPTGDRKVETKVASTSASSPSPSDVIAPNRVPWYSYIWDYEPDRTHQERVFIRKLDIYLITILSFGYFIKNLDQTNIANAFVSGMKEDLHMNGNEINLIDTAWTVGYVVGQIPSQIILTKVRPSVWVPSCELVWTILTFSLAAAKTSNHVIAIRFFIGLAESIFYPAAHTILGSWYKPSELGKRACIFHASSAVASMFSGYLQAGVYKGLNGVHGYAGWKWLFIMDGVISAPICLAGFFLIPDLPENTRAFYLDEDDRALAKQRMLSIGRAPRKKLGRSAFKRIFGRWHVYLLTILYIIFINIGPSASVNPFSLWLKAQGLSVSKINIIPTGASAVQLVCTVSFAIISDAIRRRAPLMTLASCLGLFSVICLAIWNIPAGLKWVAFFLQRASVPYGPLSISWANEICGADAEERAIVIGIMNSMGYAFNAWVPILTYPQVDSPKFRKGFIFSICAFVAQLAITGAIAFMWKRDGKKKQKESEGDEEGSRDAALAVTTR